MGHRNRTFKTEQPELLPEAALIWYSGNSKANGRGTIMCYTPIETGKYWGWYAQWILNSQWQVSERVGIHEAELSVLAMPKPKKSS